MPITPTVAVLAAVVLSVCPQQSVGQFDSAALAEQFRAQLLTVFTGSAGARSSLHRQLAAMPRLGRRSPPVPEPPPETTALCRQSGHANCELHTVRSEDGYLLKVVRIPAAAGAVPALLLHGDLASSDSWMMRKDKSNLGTVLNAAGYDVWVANFRGSTHGRGHASLNTTDPRFWNFSWHEMGVYDIPAFVDYILAHTKAPTLHLVGHSMASSAALVTLSVRPEYNAKIRLASFMSPSIRFRRGIIRGTSDLTFRFFRNNVEDFLGRNDFVEIWHRSATLHAIGDIFCMDDSPLIALCYRMFEEVLGKSSPDQRLPDYLATFGAYHPAGTSFRCIEHFGVINLGRFRPFGKGVNDPNPPADYNLTAVSAPVALYYSTTDGLIDPKDVDRLARLLPKVHDKYLVPHKRFNHVDFMWAKDARSLVYNKILSNMKELDSKLLNKNAID
ncbi:lipase 3-like [Thrips palmi]|uniref:Lipase 3-like n=1 Tax=Thrips palmi TaxID=161013 RepID=A0A6P8Y886_THRPL|nr:lipase 3-like [Thrips palmi]